MTIRRTSRTPLLERAANRGVLAAIVLARREELALTQVEVAELAGVGARFVNDLEAGKGTVRWDKVLVVLHALGLHLEVEHGGGQVSAGPRAAAIYGLTPPQPSHRPTP